MYNTRIFSSLTARYSWIVLAFLFLTLIGQLRAEIIIQDVTVEQAQYLPNEKSTIAVQVNFETTQAEFLEYLSFRAPLGWTLSLTANANNPLEGTACGNVIVSSLGAHYLVLGKESVTVPPVGDSKCGVFKPGTYTFYLDVTAPSNASGNHEIVVEMISDAYLNTEHQTIGTTFALAQVNCNMTCPADIVVSAEPGLCGANVTIPLPTINSGTCTPSPTDMSGFYPVGVTEVTFTADGNSVSGEVACTMLVTVNDEEAPIFTACDDITESLSAGDCGTIVNFAINATDNCTAESITIEQWENPIGSGSISCFLGNTSFYRVYDLTAMGYTTDIELQSVTMGIYQSFNSPVVHTRIYELNGPIALANLSLVKETATVLPTLFIQDYSIPLLHVLDKNKTYVVEFEVPSAAQYGQIMQFRFGTETEASFLRSGSCGENEIVDIDQYSTSAIAMITLEGIQRPYKVELAYGQNSGSYFEAGVNQQQFTVTDKAGNTTSCTFDITINPFTNTSTTLACNDKVNVSLNQNCEGIVTADMVLEGNSYSCYEDYTIVIKDSYGASYGSVITSDMIGKDLIVEVTDQYDNTCWGNILIEDKLPPVLECATRITQCTESVVPGTALAPVMRFTQRPNATISGGDFSLVEIPFDINGLNKAIVQDINVELDITHQNTAELAFELEAPDGTIIPLAFQPGLFCQGEDLNIIFDDESVNLYNTIYTLCDASQTPSVQGDFRPFTSLSLLDGTLANGTWILRIQDFIGGNGGKVQEVTLEITQAEGIVGLPIPNSATFTSYGDKSFFVMGFDPCGPVILSYQDEEKKQDCTSDFSKIIYRTYTATDPSGNNAVTCVDTINVLRTGLGGMQFPPNYDDIQLPSFNCNVDYPTPEISGKPEGAFCENVKVTYDDQVIDLCAGSYKILRKWSVYEWCTSEIREKTQIIMVTDKVGPDITCPSFTQAFSTDPNGCTATIQLPIPKITDNCTGNPTYSVTTTSGDVIFLGGGYRLINVEPGAHVVTYTATDDCNKTTICEVPFEVKDLFPPTAVCDEQTIVALTDESSAKVMAYTFDDKSYDDCSKVTYSARRMTDQCDVAGNTTFNEYVNFCCEDIGDTIMVEFRVEDASLNFNTCMVEVVVVDKLPPVITLPPHVTIACHDTYENPELTGGYASVYDNCTAELTFEDVFVPTECGEGLVYRNWKATDPSGNTTIATQFISLENDDPFDETHIVWLNDTILTNCIENTHPDVIGYPSIIDDVCAQVSVTYEDDIFTVVGDACSQILRTWTVIDDCQYNLNNPKYGQGWWKDIQVIYINNSTAPEFVGDCEDIVVETFGECRGDLNLKAEATDDCTPSSSLVYTWKIDEFNTYDGIYEYEGVGNTIALNLENGKHRVLWTVSDQCGNVSKCEYVVEMKDGKAPTPYCLSSLSTAVMNNNGSVTIWATDFDKGAEDNCTPKELLKFSFEPDTIVNAKTFDCSDIPNGVSQYIELKIWVFDEAGNKDFCTVSLLVEDNEANFCDDSGTITIDGVIKTKSETLMHHVDVELKAPGQTTQYKNTGTTGTYAFDLIPNVNYSMEAQKKDDPLNGVTTLDIILIQKHILGISSLDTPYDVIAADVNNDAKITGSDIVILRKLILGLIAEMPVNQKEWQFVDGNQTFPDESKPFPYNTKIDLDLTYGIPDKSDFIAVKIGDVNQSSKPNGFKTNVSETRSGDRLDLLYYEQSFKKGDEVKVKIFSDNFEEIYAYQTTFEWDPELLSFKSMEALELPVTALNFNFTKSKDGKIASVWDTTEPFTAEDLFVFTFIAQKDGTTKDFISLSSAIAESMAYDKNYTEIPLSIGSKKMITGNTIIEKESWVVEQNRPNPFKSKTNIAFTLPSKEQVYCRIYDVQGNEVYSQESIYNAGKHQIEITKQMLSQTGVYYCTLMSTYGVETQKMILID